MADDRARNVNFAIINYYVKYNESNIQSDASDTTVLVYWRERDTLDSFSRNKVNVRCTE